MTQFTPFKDPIFYGNGSKTGKGQSDLAIDELKKQVDLLMSINSGLQQPCHCETEKQHAKHLEEVRQMEKARYALGKSIVKALNI